MTKTSGTLLEKMKDRRFRRTEEAIFKLFAEKDFDLTVNTIVNKIDISSSTFYRHHHGVTCILADYEHLIIEYYINDMSAKINKTGVKIVIYWALIFIMNNKELIKVVAKKDNYSIIYQMIMASKIMISEVFINVPDKIFNIYALEVCGVIMEWQKCDYSEEKLREVGRNIMYLTETVKERLGPLTN